LPAYGYLLISDHDYRWLQNAAELIGAASIIGLLGTRPRRRIRWPRR
jgi:hypothetical protein